MPRLTQETTDDELVRRFRVRRDRGAFEELLSRHRRGFNGLLRKWFIPGSDRDDLEQEILIGFTKAVRDFDSEAGITFGSFANGCVKRHLITSIRAANRNKHQALTHADRLDAPLSSSTAGDSGPLTLADRLQSRHMDPAERIVRRAEFEMLGAILGIGISPNELEHVLAHISVESVPDVASRLVAAGDGNRGQALTLAEAEVLLYRLLDVSYVEAGELMDKDPKYVDNCFQRVRKKARHALHTARSHGEHVAV